LSSTDIKHPAIEALFTIDEETGMTGAMQLDPSNFEGEILLNLDTEDDDELSIGCAGGIDTNTEYSCSLEDINSDSNFITINVSGLIGGHSGMDIDKGRGNANKIITRILLFLNKSIKFQLISIDGGSLRNAIPREANAVIAYDKNSETELNQMFQEISDKIITEFQEIEGELVLKMTSCQSSERAVSEEDKMKILNTLTTVHNGVFRMSPEIDGLVETSSSLARVILKEGLFSTQSLQRSSVESTKDDVANTIRACFELMGCDVVQNGDYPGWKPNPNSEILQLMADMYRQRFNEEPQIKACHAGLECGILLKHLPNVDMISFGPNIRAAHSPDEKVQISSVSKFWDFFLEVLNQTPAK